MDCLHSLDPHSNFLDEEAYASLQEEQHGSFYGLGITIQSINGILTVISPIEGTPAFKAGLRAGDVISEIEGQATKGKPTNVLLKQLARSEGNAGIPSPWNGKVMTERAAFYVDARRDPGQLHQLCLHGAARRRLREVEELHGDIDARTGCGLAES